MKKNINNVLAVLVIVLSLIVIAMGVYIGVNKDSGKDELGDNSVAKDNNKCVNNELDVEELNKFGKSDFNILKIENDSKHTFSLDINGTVSVDFNENIENISDAKDIILFTSPTDEYILYILTKSGNVYKYNSTSTDVSNFNAVKLDEYSNIQEIITYNTRKANAGGCNYILLIDSIGKYFELTSFCV